MICATPCTQDGLDGTPAAATWSPQWRAAGWLGLILIMGVHDFALRAEATTWWVARGGEPGSAAMLGSAALGALGIAAVVGALASSVGSRRGWPVTMLLLATAALMQPVASILAFSFHDTELALAWSLVQVAVLAVVVVQERRHRLTAVMSAVALISGVAFAVTMLAVTPLTW